MGPACGQDPLSNSRRPSFSEIRAGSEDAGEETVCLTLEPTAVCFQLWTKMSRVTRLPYLPQLVLKTRNHFAQGDLGFQPWTLVATRAKQIEKALNGVESGPNPDQLQLREKAPSWVTVPD